MGKIWNAEIIINSYSYLLHYVSVIHVQTHKQTKLHHLCTQISVINCTAGKIVFFSHHIPVRLSDWPKVQQTRLQEAHWCGNTTTLVMVADNDIYLRFSPLSSSDFRLTKTGQHSLIYNGIPDWLYQGTKLTVI